MFYLFIETSQIEISYCFSEALEMLMCVILYLEFGIFYTLCMHFRISTKISLKHSSNLWFKIS